MFRNSYNLMFLAALASMQDLLPFGNHSDNHQIDATREFLRKKHRRKKRF